MDVGAAVIAAREPSVVVQPGEGALDYPALASKPRAVIGVALGDLGGDAPRPQLRAMAAAVVGAVGQQRLGAKLAVRADRRDTVDKVGELGDGAGTAARRAKWKPDTRRRPPGGKVTRAIATPRGQMGLSPTGFGVVAKLPCSDGQPRPPAPAIPAITSPSSRLESPKLEMRRGRRHRGGLKRCSGVVGWSCDVTGHETKD